MVGVYVGISSSLASTHIYTYDTIKCLTTSSLLTLIKYTHTVVYFISGFDAAPNALQVALHTNSLIFRNIFFPAHLGFITISSSFLFTILVWVSAAFNSFIHATPPPHYILFYNYRF